MAFLASLTKRQWASLLILLFLNLICLYGGVIPLVIYVGVEHNRPPLVENPPEPQVADALDITPTLAENSSATPSVQIAPTSFSRVVQVLAPTRTSTRIPASPTTTVPRVPTRVPTLVRPSPTSSRTASPVPTMGNPPIRLFEPQVLAALQLNPRVSLANRTTFFTSACFGADANPLQDRDNMAPADWAGSPDRKCIFGFRVDPRDGMPVGRYSVFGGPDGVPRFYIIPPEAFASDTTQVKQLSQMHLIVDPTQGCSELGSIGITADGASYQCQACAFLRAGGTCLSQDGTKSLALPSNSAFILDSDRTGGAIGFQGFPLVFFKRGFSVFFTGKSGYAPSRVYFESTVDTLRQEVSARTTSEMTNAEIHGISTAFDNASARGYSLASIAALEQLAQPQSPNTVKILSKGTGSISFRAPPESVLSSIAWTIRPMNNVDKKAFLETNFCMDLNGERTCFTGVEDFAHCAFFSSCTTGFSSLVSTGDGGYVATRYFLPGAAPAIHDPNITIHFQAPDIGTVLEMNVQLRVRSVDQWLIPRK